MSAELILEDNIWWHRPDEVAALYLYLVDNDLLDPSDTREVAYVLSKPWKYNREHGQMIARREANDADELLGQLEATTALAHGQVSAIRKGRAVVMRRRA